MKWPTIIKNEQVYAITKSKPWSKVVKKRQLSWFGHLARLPDNTPAKLSFNHVLHHPFSRPRGRQPTTWISMMEQHLREHNTDWEKAYALAKDRAEWNQFMRSHCDS